MVYLKNQAKVCLFFCKCPHTDKDIDIVKGTRSWVPFVLNNMAKAKQRKIRNSGAIPERRHDAFLVALLLALFLNISFFAIQALIPRLSYLLQLFGPAPLEQLEPDADAFPFVLVPADLLDEEILSQTPPQALSTANREARQTDPQEDLPFDRAYVEEGVEEITSALDGQTGPAESSAPQPESAPSQEQTEAAESPPDESREPEEIEPSDEPVGEEPPPEPVVPPEPVAPPEPAETPEPDEFIEPPEPDVQPDPEPEPEPEEDEPFDPALSFAEPEPEEDPAPAQPPEEQLPEPLPEPEDLPEPEPEPIAEPEYQAEPVPEDTPEGIDLAALPQSHDGYLDRQRQYLEEQSRREEQERREMERRELERREQEYLEQQRQYEEYQRRLEQQRQMELQRQQEELMRRQEYERQQELLRQQEYERRQEQLRQHEELHRRQEYERRQELQRQQEQERQEYERQIREEQQRQLEQQRVEQQQPRERTREGRRQPTFKKIGPSAEQSENSRESRPSAPGGAPRQRNQSSRISLLDSDPNMKVLAHRYGEYMKKLAEQLQQSLNREVILNPTYYTRGQAKIFFTISPKGLLGYYDTQYPVDGELDYVRVTSERTLINAAPFDPPTKEMLQDPLFKRMSLTVTLH